MVSALSLISLRRNGISTTSSIPTTRLPAPSSAKSFAYPGFVATAVVPVGFGIIPEKSIMRRETRESKVAPVPLGCVVKADAGAPGRPRPRAGLPAVLGRHDFDVVDVGGDRNGV